VRYTAILSSLPPFIASVLLSGCAFLLVPRETVLGPGESISITTSQGTIVCDYVDSFRRRYSWNGHSRVIWLSPRDVRWHGALGLYSDGFILSTFPKAGQVSRIVAQESQLSFRSMEEFLQWKKRSWIELVFNDDGYGGGWNIALSREQLNVNVWRVLIGGQPPKDLVGTSNGAVEMYKKDGGER